MHPNSPWLIRRDELHLLEERFDELFSKHDDQKDESMWKTQERVWREYTHTEAEGDAALTTELGEKWMDTEHRHEHCRHEGRGVLETLRQESARDPLYARAAAWGTELARWALQYYRGEGAGDVDVYRLCLYAPLVPIKISYAISEGSSEGEYSDEIAYKEIALAQMYVGRARESLTRLKLRSIGSRVGTLAAQAKSIEDDLTQLRKRLKRGSDRPV